MSIVFMKADEGLQKNVLRAAELGYEKVREMYAKRYADKFAAFNRFEARITSGGEVDCVKIEHQLDDLWTHLVVDDDHWEIRASFSVMVTNIVLKVMSSTNKTKAAKELALWCLKGGDGGGSGGEGKAFGGLLSIMAHGDPKSAKDRKVESPTLSLISW